MITFTGLRAHVIPRNLTNGYNGLATSQEYNNEAIVDNSLSFLNGFVFKDPSEPWSAEVMPSQKRIHKRSISRSPVPQYMINMYNYLSNKRYKVKFDTARSFRSTGKHFIFLSVWVNLRPFVFFY